MYHNMEKGRTCIKKKKEKGQNKTFKDGKSKGGDIEYRRWLGIFTLKKGQKEANHLEGS